MIHPESRTGVGRATSPYGDVRFLNLHGTPASRARDLGARLQSAIARGPVPFLSHLTHAELSASRARSLTRTLEWGTSQLATRRLRHNLPRELRDALDALAASSGLPADTVHRAHLMPESLQWLRSRLSWRPSLLGCTSLLACAANGSLLHARNLDAPGIGAWDRFTTLAIHHPPRGLAYLSITSAGMFGAGHTAMNAARLTLALHQHDTREVDLDASPTLVASDAVMRQAHDLDGALEILRQHPTASGWTWVLTHQPSGRAMLLERAPGSRDVIHHIHPGDRPTAYTNVYWDPGLAALSDPVTPTHLRHAASWRQGRAQDLLDERPRHTHESLAHILADLHDPSCDTPRLLGPTLANLSTIASVVFDPEHLRVWIAAGPAPTSRGWFLPFTLHPNSLTGAPDEDVAPFCVEPHWHDSRDGRAVALTRQAHRKNLERPDDDRRIILIEHALALRSDEPHLHTLAALLALRAGRAQRAIGALERARSLPLDPGRRADVELYLAMALDLQGDRRGAKALYKVVARDDAAGAQTRRHARSGKRSRWTLANIERLSIDFLHAMFTG